MAIKSVLTRGLWIVAALTFAGIAEAQEWKAKYPAATQSSGVTSL
jgi:hypothetical protein